MPHEQFPLLFFPKPRLVAPTPRKPGGGTGKGLLLPSREQQSTRLDRRFSELDRVFENQTISVTGSADGTVPESVLVVEILGSVPDFQLAMNCIEMEWLAEFDLDDVEPEDGFGFADPEKKVPSRVLFSFSNHTARQELLRLWNLWKNGSNMPHGKTSWRDIFHHLKDIRPWSLQDRVQEYGMLEIWKTELENGLDAHVFEIELWCSRDPTTRSRDLAQVIAAIEAKEGRILGSPLFIEAIDFLAIKAELPSRYLAAWIEAFETDPQTAIGPFGSVGIRYLRPMGCSVSLETGESQVDEASQPTFGAPLVAVLDGYPLANHQRLRNRITIHDPEEFAEGYENFAEMRHGTAMCSLVSWGELDAPSPLRTPLYCRPILQPNPEARVHKIVEEEIPADRFPEDIVWSAVRDMFESREDQPAAAPTVKVINLSVGDRQKPFLHHMSSWGQLLDWLAWKYKVLFIVSTGNQSELDLEHTPWEFAQLPDHQRSRLTLQALTRKTRNRAILSPAEAINALTVGAAHRDAATQGAPGPNRLDVLPDQRFFSPLSRHGHGFKRSIKPEVLFPGGRQFYNPLSPGFRIATGYAPPGTRTATPGTTGELNHASCSRGSSNAAALASNAAGRLCEMLQDLATGPEKRFNIPSDAFAPLIKALIVHGAKKADLGAALLDHLGGLPTGCGNQKEFVSRFLGYGHADVDRVLGCTRLRATVLGCGVISASEPDTETLHEFHLPLPPCLNRSRALRRLTITLAWLSPVTAKHRDYRQAKLEVRIPDRNGILGTKSGENDHHQITRGTVSHDRYEGRTAKAFIEGSELVLTVACSERGGRLDEEIPYGLVVSFEVGEEVELPIYEQIRDRMRVQVAVERVRVG